HDRTPGGVMEFRSAALGRFAVVIRDEVASGVEMAAAQVPRTWVGHKHLANAPAATRFVGLEPAVAMEDEQISARVEAEVHHLGTIAPGVDDPASRRVEQVESAGHAPDGEPATVGREDRPRQVLPDP